MDAINLFVGAIGKSSFDAPLLKNATCIKATKDEVNWRLHVVPELCNSLGTMHGGAIAAGIDLFTSAALCPHRREDFWELQGVSRSLNVMYLRPAPEGTHVIFYCKVVSLGRRTAALNCVVVNEASRKIIATGVHDKVNIDKPSEKL